MMKGISSIIAILGLSVIMTVKAAPVDDINTGSDKEMNTTDINYYKSKSNNYARVFQKNRGWVNIPCNNSPCKTRPGTPCLQQ